jgi:hypothetical protein
MKNAPWQGDNGVITEGVSRDTNNDGVFFKCEFDPALIYGKFSFRFTLSNLGPSFERTVQGQQRSVTNFYPYSQLYRRSG